MLIAMNKLVATILIISLTLCVSASIRNVCAQIRRPLFYGPASTGWESSVWIANGFPAPVTVNDSTWSGMTAQDFSSYSAIVFCDPGGIDSSVLGAADANKDVWSSVITGPVIVLGTDPEQHQTTGNASALALNGIQFAASGSGTGLYACLSTYWWDAASPMQVSFLSAIGNFTIIGQDSANNSVTIVAPSHPAMAGLTDQGLSNWGNSVHEFFLGYPASFGPLVVADRPGDSVLPYIIASGATTAVGGEIFSVNVLQFLAPYLVYAFVVVGAVLSGAKFKRRIL